MGVAAYGVVANFALVATAIFNGVAQGAQPLVSRCYGQNDHAGARKLLLLGSEMCIRDRVHPHPGVGVLRHLHRVFAVEPAYKGIGQAEHRSVQHRRQHQHLSLIHTSDECIHRAGAAGRTDKMIGNARRVALGIFSVKIILFRGSETPVGVSEPHFHGRVFQNEKPPKVFLRRSFV